MANRFGMKSPQRGVKLHAEVLHVRSASFATELANPVCHLMSLCTESDLVVALMRNDANG
jgi:hypothetical protein